MQISFINCQIIQITMITAQDKIKTRNATPTLIRFKRKSLRSSLGKTSNPSSQQNSQRNNSDRSSSKASKCSFQAHQHRILHLSRLSKIYNYKENQLKFKNTEQKYENDIHKRSDTTPQSQLVNQKLYEAMRIQRDRSNSNPRDRENLNFISIKDKNIQLESKYNGLRKHSVSGRKISISSPQRKYSNNKRNQQSLQKQQERAKAINNELINNLMKNKIAPNYFNKLRNRKQQIQRKKTKKFLNVDLQIHTAQELKNYEILGQLGKGAYGIVKMGICKKNDEKVAIKIYEKKKLDEPNKIKNLTREINILAKLNHPTISRIISTIQTSTEIYLILEYGGANSLYNYLLSKPQHRLPEHEAIQFFKVIAQAIKHLHDQNIVHRDIKAQNILLNRHRQLKLIDFGFSIQNHPQNKIDTFCGTPTYMAPQIVSKVDHYPIYTDMWSLGVLLFVFLQGNYPFRAKNENDLFEKIQKGQFEYIHPDISDQSKNVIQSLIKVNPYERLTIDQLLSSKYQSWYRNAAMKK